ncbi:MAG: hypothetical protein JSS43_17765, partial [Proteobacteria bacterium]|nr:hypothetical protein [Pseudomonadota bacterium]
ICLVTAAMGSFHWLEGMALHEEPFDFSAPGLPGHPPDPALELVPYDLMARHCRGGIGWQLSIVKDMLRFTSLPIFHIEAPPPVANMDLMVQGAASHPMTREGLEKTGAASPSFRLKVWWAWTVATREACASLGIHFVEAPPETRDAQGFLDERYFLDGVHGNEAYGALLVQEVATAKRRLGLEPSSHA